MLYRVCGLEGELLDGAVTVAEGLNAPVPEWWTAERGAWTGIGALPYSSEWEHGGPIIERERIAIYPPLCVGDYDEWSAVVGGKTDAEKGRTALIAAMRAYVAAKLGDEIDLP